MCRSWCAATLHIVRGIVSFGVEVDMKLSSVYIRASVQTQSVLVVECVAVEFLKPEVTRSTAKCPVCGS